MKQTATEEISMIEQFCPNPVVLQRLLAGPLNAHINAIAQQLSQQGYTSSSAKNALRLLDDLSSWLLRQALTAADFNGFCRKVRFLGQNPKIGYQKFNDIQT